MQPWSASNLSKAVRRFMEDGRWQMAAGMESAWLATEGGQDLRHETAAKAGMMLSARLVKRAPGTTSKATGKQSATGPRKMAGLPRFRARACQGLPHQIHVKVI